MSNYKQSSVEWLVNSLIKLGYLHSNGFGQSLKVTEVINQAKAMHKEDIIQAYSNGWHDGQDAIIMKIEHIDKGGDERGLKYYDQL